MVAFHTVSTHPDSPCAEGCFTGGLAADRIPRFKLKKKIPMVKGFGFLRSNAGMRVVEEGRGRVCVGLGCFELRHSREQCV